jgi:subtilisin family serine protease
MKKNIVLILLLGLLQGAMAQNSLYWVLFADKDGVGFDPYEYFDAKAIERRLKANLPLSEPSDYPVKREYKAIVGNLCEKKEGESRWLNAVAVWANKEQLQQIRTLPFVRETRLISSTAQLAGRKYTMELNRSNTFILKKQIEGMKGKLFSKSGYTGKGVRIAIFDAGFPTVDINPVFEHIRNDNRIIDTWDFVKEKPFVYSYNSHGTACMSCIGGIADDQMMGLAPDAEYLLARTEKNTEPFSEEVNWMQAMEWADKKGADIISSSLGYTDNRYFTTDMNGKTSFVTRAANIAASKGILVVNAMGNEGSGNWKYMGAPADADSILSVGGLDPFTDYHIDFSSYGPTADKRQKPNVCGYGHAITAGKIKLKDSYGTSFATPLVAGFVACAWQARPELSNMELIREIEKSAHLFPYRDYAHGYGMPQADYFVGEATSKTTKELFSFVQSDNDIVVTLSKEQHRYLSIGEGKLYYHIREKNGEIIEYAVVAPYQDEVITIPMEKLEGGRVLMVFYNGFSNEFAL